MTELNLLKDFNATLPPKKLADDYRKTIFRQPSMSGKFSGWTWCHTTSWKSNGISWQVRRGMDQSAVVFVSSSYAIFEKQFSPFSCAIKIKGGDKLDA